MSVLFYHKTAESSMAPVVIRYISVLAQRFGNHLPMSLETVPKSHSRQLYYELL